MKLLSEELLFWGDVRDSPFGLLAPNVTVFLVSGSLLSVLAFCHGRAPGSGSVFLASGTAHSLVVFPLQTSPLAWCRWGQCYLYPNLGSLKAYMF